jgi:hypothetical protein
MRRISQSAFLRSALFVGTVLAGMTVQVVGSTPILRSADLKPYADVHRLVIVFPGDQGREEAFLDQWDSAAVHSRMNHRSVLVFRVKDRTVIEELRKRLASDESGFRVWLIGLRGRLVFSTSDDIEPGDIFDRIDAMPGRQTEIRRHNDWEAGRQVSP